MNNETDLDWLARNVHEWPAGATHAANSRLGLVIFGCPVLIGGWFTKSQWLTRRAELQNKPSWEDAPAWAQYLVQNSIGLWTFTRYEPRPNSAGGWSMDRDVQRHGNRLCVNVKDEVGGEVFGDWRDTLEKRPEQKSFEPFVSVEDAAIAQQHSITPSKYTKTIHGVPVDVYDVLQAWGVSNPALQHLIKKALQCGQRGHKDNAQDLQDIIDSAIRAKELG